MWFDTIKDIAVVVLMFNNFFELFILGISGGTVVGVTISLLAFGIYKAIKMIGKGV